MDLGLNICLTYNFGVMIEITIFQFKLMSLESTDSIFNFASYFLRENNKTKPSLAENNDSIFLKRLKTHCPANLGLLWCY